MHSRRPVASFVTFPGTPVGSFGAIQRAPWLRSSRFQGRRWVRSAQFQRRRGFVRHVFRDVGGLVWRDFQKAPWLRSSRLQGRRWVGLSRFRALRRISWVLRPHSSVLPYWAGETVAADAVHSVRVPCPGRWPSRTGAGLAFRAVIKQQAFGGQGLDNLGAATMLFGFDFDLCRRTVDNVEKNLARRHGIGGRKPVNAPAASAARRTASFHRFAARSRSLEWRRSAGPPSAGKR